MTILAQLRDCHSCYDERSMVQKKKARFVVSQGPVVALPRAPYPLP